jgi:hypothetical protein
MAAPRGLRHRCVVNGGLNAFSHGMSNVRPDRMTPAHKVETPTPTYQFKGVYSSNGKITYQCETPGTARGMKKSADKSVAASKKWYNKVKDVPKSYFLFGLGGPNIGCPVASGARTGTVRTYTRTKIKQRVK